MGSELHGPWLPRTSVDLSGAGFITQWDELQIYYIGQHGNDANSGRAINQAFLTIGAACAAAVAAGPTTNNRFALVVLDDGVYVENVSLPAWCGLHAPNAKLSGTLTLADDSWAVLDEVQVGNNVVAGAVRKTAGDTSTSIVEVRKLIAGNASIGFVNPGLAGTLSIRSRTVTIGAGGTAVGDVANPEGNLVLDIDSILLSGGGCVGVVRNGAGYTVGRVGVLAETGGASTGVVCLSAGSADLDVGRLETTTSYVKGAGVDLNLRCALITGVAGVIAGTEPNVSTPSLALRTLWPDSATRPPWGITPRNAPPVGEVAVNDVYLDDGTNTGSGQRGWRQCTALGPPDTWVDVVGGVAQWLEQQVYYIGKHGNDTNSGRAINQAFLTIGAARAAAVAAGPTTNNRFALVVLDDGIYAENVSLPAWCGLHAPNAKLSGTLTLADDSWAVLDEVEVGNAVPGAVTKAVGGTARSIANVRKIVIGNGSSGLLNLAVGGVLVAAFDSLVVGAGSCGVGDAATNAGTIIVNGKVVELAGAASYGARCPGGQFLGHLERVYESGLGVGNGIGVSVDGGAVNLDITSLETTTSYQKGAGTTLNLRCGSITGAAGALLGAQPNVTTPSTALRTLWGNSTTRPPWNLTARNSPPSGEVVVGDLYLDDGTNTASRYPGTRRCSAVSPNVWRDCPATRIERDFIGLVRHVEGAVPVETLIGGCMLDATGWIDGSGNANGSPVFWANVSWTVIGACTVRVRLYDYGASPGPPAAPPTLVTTIDLAVGAGSGGPRYLSQALTVNAAGPGANIISNTARLYLAIVTIVGGVAGDVAVAEGGGLALR